jgi:hypothetical protein
MFGNANVSKDVLEYVVFERVLTYAYSQWRVHSKILPTWLPPSDPVLYTFEKPNIELIDGDTNTSTSNDSINDETKREKIAQEHETNLKKFPTPTELKTPLPTMSDINQQNRKRKIGFT